MLMKRRFAQKQNVLLVNITRLGDMLQATPTISGLKMENPDCKITVLVEKQFDEVCHFLPDIDYVKSIDLGMTVRCLSREQDGIIDAYEYVSEVVEDLRGQEFDYCLNMSSSAYTALLLKLVGITRSGGWTSDAEGFRVIESDWAKLFASSVFHQNRQFNSLNLVDVFRCSADVAQHPNKLQITINPDALEYAKKFVADAGFTNRGPLIALQAGASQGKRQWAPRNFVKLVNILVNKYDARVVLTGTKKELEIIDPIVAGCNSKNVAVAAGRTSIPQLAALLSICDVLVTGDTGPMHVSVAAGTPVVSMFLASAFGFETGPYSEGNLVLQPVIGCGPCNPNKPCARPDCHDTIDPEVVAELAMMRVRGDVGAEAGRLVDPRQAILYRSTFDQYGFCDLRALNDNRLDPYAPFRDAYRQVWLDDLGGVAIPTPPERKGSLLDARATEIQGIDNLIGAAKMGEQLIEELVRVIRDVRAPASELGRVNNNLSELDRHIEELGFHYPHLGPVSRMFVFAKENLSGTDANELASQMRGIYSDLGRRCEKFSRYFRGL